MSKSEFEGLLLFKNDRYCVPGNSYNLDVFPGILFSPFLDSNLKLFLYIWYPFVLFLCPSSPYTDEWFVCINWVENITEVTVVTWPLPAISLAKMREQGHTLHSPHPHPCPLPSEMPRQGAAPSQILTSSYGNFLLFNLLSLLLFEGRMHVIFILVFPVPDGILHMVGAQ